MTFLKGTKRCYDYLRVTLDILALHIRGQNAGLIVRKFADRYSFESFELSPTNEAVIGTKGRLRRCFPGPAVAISQDRIADATFLNPLAELLVKLDTETPLEVLPTARKAYSEVIEPRDTVHPRFVTEMLTGILRAVGQPHHDVLRIHKHTREDVLWKDTLEPWRRSPLWLFLRIVLQTSLVQKHGEEPHRRYKSFMLFFMSHVLRAAMEAYLSSDTLFQMTAKISRRALKLRAVDGAACLHYVETTMVAAQQNMISKWTPLETHSDPQGTQKSWLALKLSLVRDTEMALQNLGPYLARVTTRSPSSSTSHQFTSDHGCRISQNSSKLPDLTLLPKVGSELHLYLADLERWVHHYLNDWLSANMERQDTCAELARLIDAYTTAASSAYMYIPEEISLMLLTTMDLWVALDKCALRHYPLLRDYDPGFPPSVFEPLLLPKKAQMQQLLKVEQHLAKRRKDAASRFPSIFESVNTKKSFYVRYLQQPSLHHQNIKRKIEEEATIERSKRSSELANKRQRYHELMEQSDEMKCEYVSRWRKRRQVSEHSDSCEKCALKSEATGLTIEVHEWPLPKKDLEAQAAVFELHVPTVISKWRDTTYSILVDLLSVDPDSQGEKQRVKYFLNSYVGLQRYSKSEVGRLQLASMTKPFVNSHYRYRAISQANETNVCVNNGLNYSLYDSKKSSWTEDLLGRCDVREKCTIKLPPGPYEGLQYAVKDTIHTSNGVIADQSRCPEALTMHEYYAFGTLRSGHRLQWRNIAREITARILNFSCYETQALLTQAAWQVGPSGRDQVLRESHADLEEENFGVSFLSALGDAIGTIEGNWQGATAACTFVTLTARLLSLSTCIAVRESCYRFLRRARDISLLWIRELGRKLQDVQKEEELKNLSLRTLEMALICHRTFDVDPHYLPYLIQSEDDIAVVIECSIIVHDRCPAVIEDLPAAMQTLLRRHWRLSYVLEPILREWIVEHRDGLDTTVRRLWAGYIPGSTWIASEAPNERWLVTETSSEGGPSMLVHYNLLDGSLLVNGSSLARLPRAYESHPTFRRLFGEVKHCI